VVTWYERKSHEFNPNSIIQPLLFSHVSPFKKKKKIEVGRRLQGMVFYTLDPEKKRVKDLKRWVDSPTMNLKQKIHRIKLGNGY